MYIFNVGDLVHLKSGSPRMGVESVTHIPADTLQGVPFGDTARTMVSVVYMVYGTGEVKRATFDQRMLVPARDDRSY